MQAADIECVYLAGGHGTYDDFADSSLTQLIDSAYALGKVIAADCHGPVGLVGCKKPNGEPLVKGLRVTAFTGARRTRKEQA